VTLGVGSVGLSLLAGALSTLSPCVLPLLPIVFGAAASRHRFGMVALGAGLVIAFVSVGLFVATIGFAAGLDFSVFRDVAAVLLAVIGIVLLSTSLQARFAVATGGMMGAGSRLLGRLDSGGLWGQFVLGLALGAVWSPCVGPTLGAASLLAAQQRHLAGVAMLMAAFGLGTAGPLLLVGALSRTALTRWRGRLTRGANAGKLTLGAIALAVAVLVLTGADHVVEAALVSASPSWLTTLTTSY
jgi:cytochrome c-type biogenesis protein